MRYDCIVIGARCAGAPLARFLARGGARVLVCDAAEMPSDQPMSTHFIQPYGMTFVDELGLGDRVRAVAPPVDRFRYGCEDKVASIDFPAGQGGCCPRRIDLDPILVDGAREAGAEVRLRCRLVDLLREGDRVTGVVVDDRGTRRSIHADIVVGADGRQSTVAELTGAPEYLGYDGPRAIYWAYYPRPAWFGDDERYRGAAFIVFTGDEVRFIFPTNRDLLLLGVGFPAERVAVWRADPGAMLRARIAAHPLWAPLVADSAPTSKVLGLVKMRFFFRQAAGPGWALVGDAGLFKDPSPGLGISDALRDARSLSRAILAGGDRAIEAYWRQRDVDSLELFYFARDMGALEYNNPLNQMVFAKMATRPQLADRIREVAMRTVSPFDAFSTGQVIGWTLGALLCGRFGVLGPFLAAGKRTARVKKELAARVELARAALPPGRAPERRRLFLLAETAVWKTAWPANPTRRHSGFAILYAERNLLSPLSHGWPCALLLHPPLPPRRRVIGGACRQRERHRGR
jgi:menaquinone-9 beta-reductase